MKKILLGLLTSAALSAFIPDTAKPKTKLYVVAITGADLHETPSFTSKIARRLPLGVVVNAQQTVASDDVKWIGAGFALSGDWIEVTTPAYTGYIFSSDLTPRRPTIKKSRSGMLYIDLLGTTKSSRTEKQLVASAAKNLLREYATKDITEYANGTYTMTTYDGCFDHVYAFRQLTLNEVYHHLISNYSGYDGKKLKQPKLLSKKGNVYTFTCGFGDSDATQELQLTIHEKGILIISSSDCT
ncbi:hypothetical protein [uncultured Hymenobacter sp.]|uniref:hypothetical protein n=1 Tax=uncultured Hymenobacter sp. TaxID=170016 RepID=UPI0035CA565C